MLYNQHDAARRLLLSPRTLERLRVSGTGPRYCKLGKRVAYREADLEAWVSARVVGSTSEVEDRR
jgi:predicted DNA-binding transcriptional regulator AlpA